MGEERLLHRINYDKKKYIYQDKSRQDNIYNLYFIYTLLQPFYDALPAI